MMVKICGITCLEDALAAAEAGASAVGFNFYDGSPRRISPPDAAAIAAQVPILKVGVFVNEDPEIVRQIAAEVPLDIVQLHGGDAPAGLRYWRAIKVAQAFSPAAANGAEAILLDAAVEGLHGGTGRTFRWELARDAAPRIIIAGGLDATNVAEAIRVANPWGVDAMLAPRIVAGT